MAVAAEQTLDADVDVAVAQRVVGGVVAAVDHLVDHAVGGRLRQRPGLRKHGAVGGDDVGAAGAALDGPDVGGRAVVEAAQAHRGDRLGGGDDRAAPRLGADAGVGGLPAKVALQAVVGGRRDDDVSDRRGVVVHVAELRAQPGDVERLGARQAVLLGDGEQQLDAHGRALDRRAVREREQNRHGRLVVGAQDRLARALPGAVDQHRLDRALVRDGVEVGAQQHRALGAAGKPRQEVAAIAADLGRRVVLLDLEPERAQLRGDPVGDGALVAVLAGDGAQLGERVVQPAELDLRGGPHATPALRPRARRARRGAPARAHGRARARRRRTRGTAARAARVAT